MVLLARFVDRRCLLTLVRPTIFVRWHHRGYRLFWRWNPRRRGRPRIPAELQRLTAQMAAANRTWGEERISAELRLKLAGPCTTFGTTTGPNATDSSDQ